MPEANGEPNITAPRPPDAYIDRQLTINLKSGNSFTIVFGGVEYQKLRRDFNDYIRGKKTSWGEYKSRDDSILQILFDQIDAVVAAKK